MNEFISPEGNPEQILTLASSIAQRNLQEQQWMRSLLAETLPMPPQLPLEIMQSIQTGTTVAMLKKLENLEESVDPMSLSRIILDDKALVDILRSQNEDTSEEATTSLRNVIDGQVKVVLDHFDSDNTAQQKLIKSLETAEIIAKKHLTPIHEVFSRDDLYAECITLQNTPQQYAEEIATHIHKVDEKYILATAESMIDSMLQAELASGEITPEEYVTEKEEILQKILQDEEQLAQLKMDLSIVQQTAAHRLISRGLERFWGVEGRIETAAILGQLAIKSSENDSLPESFRERQQYNDMVTTICMEKDWDPKNLTIEQTRYVHSCPQMQSFRSGQ